MTSGFRKLVGFSLLTATFLLVGVGIYRCGEIAETSDSIGSAANPGVETDDAGVDADREPTHSTKKPAKTPLRSLPGPSPYESFVAPPNRDGPTVSFVDASGRRVRTNAVVGAPGLWPSPHIQSDASGRVTLPKPGVTTLRGESIEQYEILARAPAHRLAFWGDVTPSTQRTYRLTGADGLRIRVVDPNADPVAAARVSVGRGPLGFIRLSGESGEDGLIEFRTLPEGEYRVRVRKGSRWGRATIEHDVEAAVGTGVESQPSDEAIWVTLRPKGEARVSLPDPSGQASFGGSAASGHGQTGTDDDRKEPASPVRSTVRLRVRSLPVATWRNADFYWRAHPGAWQRGQLERRADGSFSWRNEVEGVSISFKIESSDGVASESFELNQGETQETWRVSFTRQVSLYVVDSTGAPVTGAKIFVWRQGELEETMLSGGTRPRKLRIPVGSGSPRIRVSAAYGGMGEAIAEVAPERGELTLKLSAAGMSQDWPGRVLPGDQLGSFMEADIVESPDGVQIDPLPGGWAANQGVGRGAWILAAQDTGDSVTLHLQQQGRHRVLTVPATAFEGSR